MLYVMFRLFRLVMFLFRVSLLLMCVFGCVLIGVYELNCVMSLLVWVLNLVWLFLVY